jgi:hypothetical protein
LPKSTSCCVKAQQIGHEIVSAAAGMSSPGSQTWRGARQQVSRNAQPQLGIPRPPCAFIAERYLLPTRSGFRN